VVTKIGGLLSMKTVERTSHLGVKQSTIGRMVRHEKPPLDKRKRGQESDGLPVSIRLTTALAFGSSAGRQTP